jgi:CheY-like chemotaxis protein
VSRPKAIRAAAGGGVRPLATQEPAPAGAAPLVLLAENSRVNQIVATRALERCGARVEVASDGGQALNALASRRYDAVLVDCDMPVMDGYAATRALRLAEGAERRIPVIGMTSGATEADVAKCSAAGMDDCVAKPMRHLALLATLQRWLPALAEPTAAAGAHANGARAGATPAAPEHSLPA